MRNFNSSEKLLMEACDQGNVEKLRELIAAGANVDLRDENGDTLLIRACFNGDIAIVKELIAAGADVNSRNILGATALMYAALKGDVAILKELIVAGANVDLRDVYGTTALMYASKLGNVEVIKELIIAKADMNLKDAYGDIALIHARDKGHPEVIKKLIVVEILMEGCKQGNIEELIETELDVNMVDEEGKTALIRACIRNDIDMVRKLIIAEVDMNLKDASGKTALMYASKLGYKKIVKELIYAGAVMDKDEEENIKKLLESGEDVDEVDKEGKTALIRACKEGDINKVKELISRGISVKIRDISGKTPLIYACERGDIEVIKELLESGVDVNIADIKGKTALMYACERGDVAVVKILIKAGADVNAIDISYKGAITHAYEKGNKELVRVLIESGADVNSVIDCEGSTLLKCLLNDPNKSKKDKFEYMAMLIRGGVYEEEILKEVERIDEKVGMDELKEVERIDGKVGMDELDIIIEGIKLELNNLVRYIGKGINPNEIKNTYLTVIEKRVDRLRKICKAFKQREYKSTEVKKKVLSNIKEGKLLTESMIQLVIWRSQINVRRIIDVFKKGDIKAEKELLAKGFNVNIVDRNSKTLLMYACEQGHLDIVKELIGRGADVNAVDKNKKTTVKYFTDGILTKIEAKDIDKFKELEECILMLNRRGVKIEDILQEVNTKKCIDDDVKKYIERINRDKGRVNRIDKKESLKKKSSSLCSKNL